MVSSNSISIGMLVVSAACPFPSSVISATQNWHDFRFRKRATTLSDRAREAYLRDDVPCGHPACTACKITRPQLSKSASHLLLPDASALETYLEVFRLPSIHSIVFLTSAINKVIQKDGRATVSLMWLVSLAHRQEHFSLERYL